MLNRILVRIKVLQIIYAYYQNGSNDLKVAENELFFSLQKAYDLYNYFLLLIVALTNLHERTIDARKHKYKPTDEELHPNMRLANNRFARQLSINEALQHYVNEHAISWDNDQDFLKSLLETILASDVYALYLDDENDSYETDKEFWQAMFQGLMSDEIMTDYLEDKSIYWNDDVEIVGTFTMRTIKHFREGAGSKQKLMPMFKSESDRFFATKLLHETLIHGHELRERISRHMDNWKTERVANIDMFIMQVALAEIIAFPGIPISVSLNEYIDLAKYYSTPKSGTFINGVLDAAVTELKKENALLKN